MKWNVSFMLFFLVGCTPNFSEFDERLVGTWFSDKELTLHHIDKASITKDQLEFLEKNLGELGFVFKGTKSAVVFKSDPDLPIDYEEYQLISRTAKSVTLRIRGDEITLTFEGNCFYNIVFWGYREYSCKS